MIYKYANIVKEKKENCNYFRVTKIIYFGNALKAIFYIIPIIILKSKLSKPHKWNSKMEMDLSIIVR